MKKVLCKRFLSLFLALIAVFSMLSFSVSASGADIVFEEKLDGDKLTVSVFVTDAAKLNAAEFELYYNENILYFNGFYMNETDSEDLYRQEKYSHYYNDFSDPPYYRGFFIENLAYAVSAGSSMLSKFHIADLVFTVNPGAEYSVNGTEITFHTFLKVDENNYFFDEKYLVKSGAEKPAVPEKPAPEKVKMGDIDGDNAVTASDARVILRCAVGLDKLSSDVIAYANLDYDNAITASDARLALRTAVGMETLTQHAFVCSGNKYTCAECGKAFVLGTESDTPAPHTHDFKFVDCYSPMKCSCGEAKGEIPAHSLDKNELICTICGFDFQTAMVQIGLFQEYQDATSECLDNVLLGFDVGNYAYCIANALDALAPLSYQIKAISGNKDLENVYNAYSKAFNILKDALLSISVDSKIQPTKSNAVVIVSAVEDVLDNLIIGMEDLGRIIEIYLSYAE